MNKMMYIIAGPNGAGKTSSAYTILPTFLSVNEFVNADEIAKGLSPLNYEGSQVLASKIMIKRIHYLINDEKSFAVETTLASRMFLELISFLKNHAYRIGLIFLYLASHQLACDRVKMRVEEGGHNVSEDIIKRRYYRGLKNLHDYLKVVDTAVIYKNDEVVREKIFTKENANETIFNNILWNKIVEYRNDR